MKILLSRKVPVIPTALSGLWGSMYSRKNKSILRYIPKAFFSHKVSYTVGSPISPEKVTMDILKEEVAILRGDNK